MSVFTLESIFVFTIVSIKRLDIYGVITTVTLNNTEEIKPIVSALI